MSSVIGAQTRVIDLEGKVVLPGFHDRHVHPVWWHDLTRVPTTPIAP